RGTGWLRGPRGRRRLRQEASLEAATAATKKAPSGAFFHCVTIIRAMGSLHELTTSALEQAARVDLAAAFRLAVRLDLHEGVCNHFSAMLADGRTFLLNRYGLHWSEVTGSNLLALDAAGRILAGEGEYEKTAFWIHSRLHLAHPHAAC